jgi:hypothetical protein
VLERDDVRYGRATKAGVAAARAPACAVLDRGVELVDASLSALAAEALPPAPPKRLLTPPLLLPDGSR